MSDHKEYYAEDLEKLRNRVNKCNSDTLDSLVYFLEEANAYTQGISDDIIKEIKDEVKKFKKDCRCERRFP